MVSSTGSEYKEAAVVPFDTDGKNGEMGGDALVQTTCSTHPFVSPLSCLARRRCGRKEQALDMKDIARAHFGRVIVPSWLDLALQTRQRYLYLCLYLFQADTGR